MALHGELRLFLRRREDGAGYWLETEEGSVVVQSRSYRQLRDDLDLILRGDPHGPRRVKVLLGSPRRPPRPMPRPLPMLAGDVLST